MKMMKRREFIATIGGIAGLAVVAPTELIAAPTPTKQPVFVEMLIKSNGFWVCQRQDDSWVAIHEAMIEGIDAPIVWKWPLDFDVPNVIHEWMHDVEQRKLVPTSFDVSFLPQDTFAGLVGDEPYKQIICCFVMKQ
jgi:hypothetical protein